MSFLFWFWYFCFYPIHWADYSCQLTILNWILFWNKIYNKMKINFAHFYMYNMYIYIYCIFQYLCCLLLLCCVFLSFFCRVLIFLTRIHTLLWRLQFALQLVTAKKLHTNVWLSFYSYNFIIIRMVLLSFSYLNRLRHLAYLHICFLEYQMNINICWSLEKSPK